MNSIHCVPVILSHVVLALSAAAGPPSRLSFNGIDYSATVGEVLLDPGTANRFVMEADGGAPLSVSFIRETPSGQEIREEQRIEGARGRAEFQFGPLAAPPVYEYDSGVVRVRGYGLAIAVRQNGDVVGHWEFRQTLARPDPKPHSYPWWRMGDAPARRLRFLAGGPATTVFDLKSRSLGPLSLRLHDAVLDDQDDLRVEVRLNRGDTPANLAARLVVVAPGGREIWNGKTSLRSSDAWETIPVQARNWPPGEYRIELHPEVEGRVWPDGPSLVYHRRAVRADAVQVSPIAPWTLDRDAARQELVITDFRAAHQRWGAGRMDPVKWKWRGQALVAGGDVQADPVVFRPPLNGSYAVFAQAEGGPGIFVQAGAEGLVRLVRPTWRGKPTFLEAGDLSGREIRIHGNAPGEAALVLLRLVPVTAVSVRNFYQEAGHPPTPMYAVEDWLNNFGNSGPFRTTRDQVELISCASGELGSRSIGWSVGRSWLEYRSALQQGRTFPCVPYEEAKRSPHYPKNDPYDYGPRIQVLERDYDPLDVIYNSRQRCGTQIWPWLAMQRHYGVNFYGGMFACPFYRDNRQWWRYTKDGQHAAGLSFFFPEVRRERVDILIEVAERGADGLVVGCDRQVPMLLYDPAMVEEYRKKTGVDARKIDASHRKAYEDWIRWRAGFFTEVLRELQHRLAPIRARLGRSIPVAVRFPTAGLFLNLAQGLDIETWCRERLVDRLQLDPLEDLAGKGVHDVRPYLELGRRHGVAVIGSVGSTGYLGEPPPETKLVRPSHVVPGMKRALGLLRAGVDGIDTYETNAVAIGYEGRFVLPLFGNRQRLEEFLRDSNVEACYPVDAGNAAAGHDNHSRWDRGWDVYGYGRNAL